MHFHIVYMPILRCPGCAKSPRLSELLVMPAVDRYDAAVAVCRRHWPREGESLTQWRLRWFDRYKITL